MIEVARDTQKVALDGRNAICNQPPSEPDLHGDTVRDEESTACSGRYPDRVGNDHLDDGVDLEALPLGCRRSGAILCVGVDCDRVAVVNNMDELVKKPKPDMIHTMRALLPLILLGSLVMADQL